MATKIHDIQERRKEDMRLNNIEQMVNDMNAKINNGLTERSIKTANKVEDLEELFRSHMTTTELVRNDISHIKIKLEDVSKRQKFWMKMFNSAVLMVTGFLFGAILWLVVHIDEIYKIVNHIIDIIVGT